MSVKDKIHKDMTFGELLRSNPQAGPVLAGYGLHCIGCHIGVSETIEQGCRAHGLDESVIKEIIGKLNGE
jgi:hybrid cluster-associated redox disulfide protein